MEPNQSEFQEMQRKVNELYMFMLSFRNPGEIDPQVARTITSIVGGITLGGLLDVTTDGATNGQVIKLNTSTGKWEPANDIDTDT
jgi:hypothetical protein